MKPLGAILKRNDDENISRTNMPMSSSANGRTDDGGGAGPRAQRVPGSYQTAQHKVGEICPICGGNGYMMTDLPIGHPDFGKAVPCRCRAQARMERRIRTLQHLSSLDTVRRLTFETFIPEPTHLPPDKAFNLRRAYETCVYFAQEPEGWLLLTGTYGCGKTHLAAAIANARLDVGQQALFMVVPDLLDHLRAAFNPQSETSYDELFEQLRTTPLLILDDLGTQSSTAWAQEKLFQLLNHRYNAQLPTVITTNQRLEDLEQRLRSRLLDVNLVNHFAMIAPDFRAGKNPTQSDLSSLAFHREQQFENFDAKRTDLSAEERANLRDVFEACRTYASTPQGWLVLAGANGCGKTHLAAAIANHQVESGRSDVMLIVAPDLLDHLRAAFSPQAATSYDRRFDEIKNTPLLILDDLGTESATPWAKEKLYQLFNYRYNALLPTVITTSSEPKKIEPWLRTRMFDQSRCQFWGIIAGGYRGSQSPPPARTRTTRSK
ncbi:MAG: ATP-binding protein [Chloroflexota bacterium]|nr:ATP-binding protein [Chloroflexota bacterium]